MIQRIQSIFLLLASASYGSLFALPFARSKESFGTAFADSMLNLHDKMGFIVLVAIGALTSFLAIFLFRNRKLQKTVTWVSVLLGFALSGFVYGVYDKIVAENPSATINLDIGFGMPLISIVMGILAVVFISKDDKLVKSMDRLR